MRGRMIAFAAWMLGGAALVAAGLAYATWAVPVDGMLDIRESVVTMILLASGLGMMIRAACIPLRSALRALRSLAKRRKRGDDAKQPPRNDGHGRFSDGFGRFSARMVDVSTNHENKEQTWPFGIRRNT